MPETTTALGQDPLDSAQEDFENTLSKIADQLSELSQAENAPTGSKSTDSFESNEVDFATSSWLLRLQQVQPWLFPSAEVSRSSIEKNALGAAQTLFFNLGVAQKPESVVEKAGVVSLTEEGAEYLSARLDLAVERMHQFQEAFEEVGKKQATTQWEESWEEVEDCPVATDQIKAKSDVWRIHDFAGKAEKGLLNLSPSYQRGDVWTTPDAQKLIESVVRGIPLPSIILLKPKSKAKTTKYEVVDGKQRLTAILRFIGKHPTAIRRIQDAEEKHKVTDLLATFRDDYPKFKKYWKKLTGEELSLTAERDNFFPFRVPKIPLPSLAHVNKKYYTEIREEEVQIGDGSELIEDLFGGTSEYRIPLIEYLNATPRQIHEVFHLYNKQGKHLNAEEIRNALFHEVKLITLVLVASGDNANIKALAPYVPEADRQHLRDISGALEGYKFGVARYRRTKVLSWIYAILFQESLDGDKLNPRSTAKQIDGLLASLRDPADSPESVLTQEAGLTELVKVTARCMEAHSSVDCWDELFKHSDRQAKWQELQLVASLVGVFLVGCVNEDPLQVLEEHRDKLRGFTKANPRPDKVQNKHQWEYIARVALGILDVVGGSRNAVSAKMRELYGRDCMPTLEAALEVLKKDASTA